MQNMHPILDSSCDICWNSDHCASGCQLGSNSPLEQPNYEQMNVIGNFNQRPRNGPYSNTYNSGWPNHLNLSWKNNQNPGLQLDSWQPPGFQQRQYNRPQKSNLESLLENFMVG